VKPWPDVLHKACNDRVRLEFALRSGLRKSGIGDTQADKIIADVKAGDFTSFTKEINTQPSAHKEA
jgi:hypothetical protein